MWLGQSFLDCNWVLFCHSLPTKIYILPLLSSCCTYIKNHVLLVHAISEAWGCLHYKMSSYQCRNSNYKDKTVSQLAYFYNGNPYTKKHFIFSVLKMGPYCYDTDKYKLTAGKSETCKWTYHFLLCINTLRPRQDGRHFPDDIFKCIFLNENV